MQNHPENIQPLTVTMRDRVAVLTIGIELDLDEQLPLMMTLSNNKGCVVNGWTLDTNLLLLITN